jgi:serine protease
MNRRGANPRIGLSLLGFVLAALVALPGLADLQAQRLASKRKSLNQPVPAVALPRLAPAPSPAQISSRALALAEAVSRRLPYVPGEAIVRFRTRASRWGQQRALSALPGSPSVDGLRWIGDAALVSDPLQPDAVAMARLLAAQPDVEFAEPNYVRYVPGGSAGRWAALRTGGEPAGVPNDSSYADLQWNLSMIGIPAAWDINPGGSQSLVVAVVDTGMTTQAGQIVAPLWTGSSFEQVPIAFGRSRDVTPGRYISPRDFTLASSVPGGIKDLSGHGTHVASTLAEDANNQLDLAGIAYRVRIMPVKVCMGYWDLMLARGAAGVPGFVPGTAGACSSGDVASGIRYAVDNGARIINVSISGPSPAQVERDAIVYAVQQGAVVTLAAGNEFEDGNLAQYPAAFASTIEGALAVGAVGKSETRAHYSSTGTYVEIAAPGGSSRDDGGGGEDQGFIWQVTLFPPDNLSSVLRPRFDRYAEVGYAGTSMAAPHVAGVAALLMSQGETDPRAIEAFLKATAKDLGQKGTDTQFGHGLLQGRAAVFGQGIWR